MNIKVYIIDYYGGDDSLDVAPITEISILSYQYFIAFVSLSEFWNFLIVPIINNAFDLIVNCTNEKLQSKLTEDKVLLLSSLP